MGLALLAAVHPQHGIPTLHCSDCHRATGSLLDFAAAGYPPVRVEMLSQPAIFRMVESIARGYPFYLPGFARPESQPATAPE